MEFVSSELLVNRVMETLSSFKHTGLLDEGKIYRWIKEENSLLNLSGYAPIKAIFELDEDNVVYKPDNYSHLWAIWKMSPEKEFTHKRKYLQHEHTYYREEVCTTVIEDEKGNIFREGQWVTNRYYIDVPEKIVVERFQIDAPLQIFQKPGIPCNYSKEFKHLSSPYNVWEEKDKFIFNFDNDFIYMEYFGNLLDEDGYPMVPNHSQIEKAIEDYIIWTFLKEMFINGYADVLQRMQYAEQQYRISHNIATSWKKLPEFMKLANFFLKRNEKFAKREQEYSRRIRV